MTVHEIILYTIDVRRLAAFYRDTVGLRLTTDIEGSDELHWVEFETGSCSLAIHSGGQGRIGEDSAQIVFKSDCLDEDYQRLDRLGVVCSEIRRPAEGIRVFDCKDLDQNVFSVEEC